MIFSQVDRLLVGISLGASAVASYAICAQLAQPIYGFAAAGLHFLFPYLSNRNARSASLRKPVLVALLSNAAFVILAAASLQFFGLRILHLWARAAYTPDAAYVLAMLIWSSALLGLNVTGTYALLATGRVRTVTGINLAAGAAMLVLMFRLAPHLGMEGFAIARLAYALISLLVYVPLLNSMFANIRVPKTAATSLPACEQR